MRLDVTARSLDGLLELTPHGLRCVAESDVHVLVVIVARDEFFAGHARVDAHLVLTALLLVPVGFLHGNPAAYDAGMDSLELGDTLADPSLERLGMGEIADDDLKRHFHGMSPDPRRPELAAEYGVHEGVKH
jgi:hypothetical protein